MRLRSLIVLVAGFVACAAIGFVPVASAQEAPPSVAATATAPYQLDFTLPSDAQSGCMVCHGDPALVRLREGALVSFYISQVDIASSTHAKQQCVGCHVDFTYSAPHGAEDWSVVARSACRNCHDEQSRAVGTGTHRPSAATLAEVSTETSAGPLPLCGDCHGSHDMDPLTEKGGEGWEDGRAAMHEDGWDVCGRCHADYWDNYNDYYHGAAYKRGAEDAPACWDCHGWHEILPSTDRASRVNPAHLVETCGQEGCHTGVDETYTEYAGFIHGRPEVEAANPLHGLLRSISSIFDFLFGGGSKT